MKLEQGWSVYIVVEHWGSFYEKDERMRYYYKIEKGIVHSTGKEYCIKCGNQLYWKKPNEIYLTLSDAIEKAEILSDKHDRAWKDILGYEIYRHWR